MAFHADRGKCGIDIRSRIIVGSLIEHQFVVRYPYSRTGFESHRHYHPLIVNIGTISAAQVHKLILKTIMAPNDRVLARYMAPRKRNGIVDRPPDGCSIVDCPLKWLNPRGINAKLCRHVNLETTTMITCRRALCQLQSVAVPRPSFRKIQLTSLRQSPNFADIPSRVAEGLARRCHGNRFRQVRDDQVPIPGPG